MDHGAASGTTNRPAGWFYTCHVFLPHFKDERSRCDDGRMIRVMLERRVGCRTAPTESAGANRRSAGPLRRGARQRGRGATRTSGAAARMPSRPISARPRVARELRAGEGSARRRARHAPTAFRPRAGPPRRYPTP